MTREMRSAISGVAIPADMPRQMFIGGRHVDAANGDRIETIDPATGLVFADVPAATVGDVDAAVADKQRLARRDFVDLELGGMAEMLIDLAVAFGGDGDERLERILALLGGCADDRRS